MAGKDMGKANVAALEAPGRVTVSRDTVVAGLLAEATGHGTGASSATRLKAWELLAKICGYVGAKDADGRATVRFDIRLDEEDAGV